MSALPSLLYCVHCGKRMAFGKSYWYECTHCKKTFVVSDAGDVATCTIESSDLASKTLSARVTLKVTLPIGREGIVPPGPPMLVAPGRASEL